MFDKILVALDRTEEAATIIDFTLSLARSETTQLLLVHFLDPQVAEVSPLIGVATLYDVDISEARNSWGQQHLEQEMTASKNWLESFCQKAVTQNITCQAECKIGNCYREITNRAKTWNADLIVIGRRNRAKIAEILLGSVSNYVIHHAPCSVLIVQGKEDER